MITKNNQKYEVKTHTHQITDTATDDAGKVAFGTLTAEDIEISNDYHIPFHAVDYAVVKTSTEQVEVDDSTCRKDNEPTPPTPEPGAPIISGADDITISEGDTFDPMAGVSATDSEGNPVEVTISGEVDTETPGEYTLTYTATANGKTTTVTRKVTVSAQDEPDEPQTTIYIDVTNYTATISPSESMTKPNPWPQEMAGMFDIEAENVVIVENGVERQIAVGDCYAENDSIIVWPTGTDYDEILFVMFSTDRDDNAKFYSVLDVNDDIGSCPEIKFGKLVVREFAE